MKSFVAEAEITIDEDPEAVFARLTDLEGWARWMPRSFVLTSSFPARTLQVGDRIGVKILGGPPSPLTISVFEPPRAIAWTGGMRGLLRAEHRFTLEPLEEGGTRVRSIETWTGSLAPVMRLVVKPLAEKLGREQLEGLARVSSVK